MSLKTRVRKLQTSTKTSRPCWDCLVKFKGYKIFKNYLAARGFSVEESKPEKISRYTMAECPRCGLRRIQDTSNMSEDEVINIHSMNLERFEATRLGLEFSPELDSKIKSVLETEDRHHQELYGEHYEGAKQAAIAFFESLGFTVNDFASEDDSE